MGQSGVTTNLGFYRRRQGDREVKQEAITIKEVPYPWVWKRDNCVDPGELCGSQEILQIWGNCVDLGELCRFRGIVQIREIFADPGELCGSGGI